jgi:hypothetical protein
MSDYVELNFFEDSDWDDDTETDMHEPMSTDFVLTAEQIKVITDCGVDLAQLLMQGHRR